MIAQIDHPNFNILDFPQCVDDENGNSRLLCYMQLDDAYDNKFITLNEKVEIETYWRDRFLINGYERTKTMNNAK